MTAAASATCVYAREGIGATCDTQLTDGVQQKDDRNRQKWFANIPIPTYAHNVFS